MQLSYINASKQHAQQLEDLDIKCFDLVWDKETWEAAVGQYETRIARAPSGQVVGFWCGELHASGGPDNYARVSIVKLGVLPRFRMLGVSRALMRDVKSFARSVGYDTRVVAGVCESLLFPQWQDCYIAGWLKKMGFRPSEPALQDAPHSLYGVTFHHAFNFELKADALRPSFAYA